MDSVNDQELWVKLSIAMASSIDTMAMVEVQHLGKLNARLVSLEGAAPAINDGQDLNTWMKRSECMTEIAGQSWLWVLGAYEVIRRAKTRLKEDAEFKSISDEISEIRIVLAKQEARSNPNSWQRPKHFFTHDKFEFGWGYWNRRGEECIFVRAQFAARWLKYGSAFVPPAK